MDILKIVPMLTTALIVSIVLVGGLSLLTGIAYNVWWAVAVGVITGIPLSMIAVILFRKGENGVVKEDE